MQRDYNNFDYLSISVKIDELDKILYCYKVLGWKERKREDDRDEEDMKYIALFRPHAIANKDRLQYLQVRMESLLNSFASIRAKCYTKSTLAAVITGICAYLFLACGLCLLFLFDWWLPVAAAIVCFSVAAGFIGWQFYFLIFVRKKERANASVKYSQTLKEIESLIDEASLLSTQVVTEEEIRQFFGEDIKFRDNKSDVSGGT
jgi:Flp pilus assembly protein TadB